MIRKRISDTCIALFSDLASIGRGGKQMFSMVVDSILVVTALWCAYSLRLGEVFTDFHHTWYLFVVTPVATVIIFTVLGIYRWVVRSSDLKLCRQLLKTSFLSGFFLHALMIIYPGEGSNPRSLFFIYALLLSGFTIVIRMTWKNFFEVGNRGEPVAIYGAGTNGCRLVSIFNSDRKYHPVVFIDDDPLLAGTTVYGLEIVSGHSVNLRAKLERLDVRRLVLAMPAMSALEYEQKLHSLEALELPVLTMPNLNELLSGESSLGEVRNVSIKDILGRGEVAPDLNLMAQRVRAKTVLVTGAGGSIGSEICRQIVTLKPDKLIVMDHSEANLYHITEDIHDRFSKLSTPSTITFLPCLGSVTDKSRLDSLFRQHNIDAVFHAAAYKHVPIVEAQPDQGVETNIFGTLNVLTTALKYSASDFLLISTDKAVRPTNAMGATKRVAELILQAHAARKTSTRISIVRFGNVLGSSGSVVPKFQKQILSGGPITLTHSNITRYFMTIPEAAQLVLQASAIAKGGDVFVLDMGKPVRIEQLAVTMTKLYGKKLHRETGNPEDIKIVVEGLRPGEKMYEELFITDSHRQTEVRKIFTAGEFSLSWTELSSYLEQLRKSVSVQDMVLIKKQLLSLAFMQKDDIPFVDVPRDASTKVVGDTTIAANYSATALES